MCSVIPVPVPARCIRKDPNQVKPVSKLSYASFDRSQFFFQIGPGIVYLTFGSNLGNGAYIQCLTPVGPLEQRMVHHVLFHWAVPNIIGKFFLLAEALMVMYLGPLSPIPFIFCPYLLGLIKPFCFFIL